MPTYINLTCPGCQCKYKKLMKYCKAYEKQGWQNHCSKKCGDISRRMKIELQCVQCSKSMIRKPSDINATNNFCSLSCAATHRNLHKTKGIRRSKLEAWLETQLCKSYPNLEIHFNKKDTINSELDIYIPSLKLAFELNGIFHYEPIFGEAKLNSIQNNDNRKFQACVEKGISFCTIDTSGQKYFKEKTSQKYLDIVVNIISKNLSQQH